jgi:hypothetical protein
MFTRKDENPSKYGQTGGVFMKAPGRILDVKHIGSLLVLLEPPT